MRPSQLKYLAAAIREGSFAAAARKMYVSPQAVSKAIRSLEAELSAPLFVKTGREARPTPFAVELALQAEEALQALDDLSSLAASRRAAQTPEGPFSLCVAATPYRCTIFHEGDFARFEEDNPGLKLRLHFHPNDACASAVKNGLVDAAVVHGRIEKPGIECRRIASQRIHAAVSKADPLAHRDSLALADLDGRLVARPLDIRCAMSLLMERCAALGVRPRFAEAGIDIQSCIRFMQAGGIILVAGGSYLRTAPPCGLSIPFRREDRLCVPVYLASPAPRTPESDAMHAYLAHTAKRNRRRF